METSSQSPSWMSSTSHNRQIPLTGMETCTAWIRSSSIILVTTGKYPSRGWKPPRSRGTSHRTASQQANTPHGDGNFSIVSEVYMAHQSQQANTPHGDGNSQQPLLVT